MCAWILREKGWRERTEKECRREGDTEGREGQERKVFLSIYNFHLLFYIVVYCSFVPHFNKRGRGKYFKLGGVIMRDKLCSIISRLSFLSFWNDDVFVEQRKRKI